MATARDGRRRVPLCRLLPWVMLTMALCAPLLASGDDALVAYLAQTATMIVFALSYNLLLGETGLLSFGHAAYAGLAAFVAAHAFARGGLPLPYLPLVGGLAAAVLAVPFGFVATRRAGTAFAMITLGIGELAAAAVWIAPQGFGGAAGVSIDRAAGPHWGSWSFGPAREAYAVIATWCVLASVAMFALTRTPFARLANAVRDNASRVAALGTDPRRVRFAMVVVSAFFAGVAGALGVIDVELASAEGVGMARSGTVLFAAVIGGTASFFGPMLGAAVLVGFSGVLSAATRAWPFYLGLLFVAVVMRAPEGIAGAGARAAAALARLGWRAALGPCLLAAVSALAWLAALVVAVQTLYATQFASDTGGGWRVGRHVFDAAVPWTWIIVAGFVVLGAAARHGALRMLRHRESATQSREDAQ